jgi:PAS domain S-box-containing protein
MDTFRPPDEHMAAELERIVAERDRLACELSAAKAPPPCGTAGGPDAMPEADLLAVFRALPDNLLLLTPTFQMVDATDVRLAATMTRREDIVGKALFDVFPDNPDNEDAVGASNLHASLARVLETRAPHEMALQRYDLRRPDGSFEERYWRPLNVPVLGPDGEVRYIVHRVEDATAQVRLEANEAARRSEKEAARAAEQGWSARLLEKIEELEAAQADLKAVLDTSISGIALLEAVRDERGAIVNFRIRLVNPAGERLVGKTQAQLQGTMLLENWPGHAEAGLFDLYARVADTGEPGELEVFYQAEGLGMWLSLSVVKVGDGVAATFTDVTERKNASMRIEAQIEALRQADQMKDQFLGILSHELRTPINAIMGFGSIMADGLAGALSASQAAFVGKILDSADALLALVNDLLDMSRVQAGKFALDWQTVALPGLVSHTLGALGASATAKGLTLVDEVPDELPPLRADAGRVSQVLANLVTNAIKYSSAGGVITVRAVAEGGWMRVEVADTGLGVPAEHQSRIFEAFTQVDMSNTRKAGGVGLGLSIVKALVEAHGGEVGVRSAGQGCGSTFYFTLPLAPGA